MCKKTDDEHRLTTKSEVSALGPQMHSVRSRVPHHARGIYRRIAGCFRITLSLFSLFLSLPCGLRLHSWLGRSVFMSFLASRENVSMIAKFLTCMYLLCRDRDRDRELDIDRLINLRLIRTSMLAIGDGVGVKSRTG
ncbi:hypothetical protein BDZ45DRAFT_237511 [Acephala macrosclerotiorum]|nr:hypothetical protein BDZ45DRAFT_237511 [Acephala macrosclerotiorum]